MREAPAGAGRAARGAPSRRSAPRQAVSRLAVAVVAVAIAAPARAAPETRSFETVVLPGARLRPLVGRRVSGLRLFRAAGGGGLEAIPFQIDQRDDDGDLVLGSEETPPPADFPLDENDELAFLARDSSRRRLSGCAPAPGVEIELEDPLDGGRAWVYLLAYSEGAAPPRSPTRYVAYDVAARRVSTPRYEIRYDASRNFLRSFRILTAAGGNGENLIWRTRMLGKPTFSLLFTRWSPAFTEEDSPVRIDGLKVGPVRVIRRVRQWVNVGRLLPDIPSGKVVTFHSESAFETPATFRIPWLVLKLLRGFRFENVFELRPVASGSRYFDAVELAGRRLDGTSGELRRPEPDHAWWALSGSAGTFLNALLTPERWRRWGASRGALIRDDADAENRYRDDGRPGVLAAGFTLEHMLRIREAGRYVIRQATVVLTPPFDPEAGRSVVAALERPLAARARPLPAGWSCDAGPAPQTKAAPRREGKRT